MISYSTVWNLVSATLLAVIALTATMEAKSSSLLPKSLLLWPAFLTLFGILALIQGIALYGFSAAMTLGIVLTLCGIQAALVNLRRLPPWPSGAIWLALIAVGIGFQFYSHPEERMMGFLWMAVGATKVIRERSASVESGLPVWIQLLYLGAILLGAYR